METSKNWGDIVFDSGLSNSLPNIPGLIDHNGFLLALPPIIETYSNQGGFRLEPIEVLSSDGNLYDVVTDVSNYDYAMREFINSARFVMHLSLNVLLSYYVEEHKVYTTLPIRIALTKNYATNDVGNSITTPSQFIVQFKDFTNRS